jgi:anti-anti-sigma factor
LADGLQQTAKDPTVNVTRSFGGVLRLKVEGRIDGYWADHLDEVLAGEISNGHHRIALDCSDVVFLSSAGVGVFAKRYKELTRIRGGFQILRPSRAVARVLEISRLAELMVVNDDFVERGSPSTVISRAGRHIAVDGFLLQVFDVDPSSKLTCRALGTPVPLTKGEFSEATSISLAGMEPLFAIGVGAFGDDFPDCRPRFGELISVAGATAYQPGDGSNVADYLIAKGPLGPNVHVLYGLACDGAFSHLIRFEPAERTVIPFSQLATACFDVAGADKIGLVVVAETAGLLGAALRRSPAEPLRGGDFFAHPSVRTRLSFSAERTFSHSVSLAAGIVARTIGTADAEQLRPIAPNAVGHVHAAAFRFRPIQKGPIDLDETVADLFEPNQLMGVMHLLSDDRGPAGAGESELIRGACWIAPVA